MISVRVNGEDRALEAGATVADVLRSLDLAPQARGIAVALDGEVVPRGEWPATAVREGARVEVLGAIGGGR